MIKKNCEECSKEFYITPSREKNKHHTCSKQCLGRLSSKLYSKKRSANCKICQKLIYYKQSHFKNIVNHTCSRKCAAIIRSEAQKGKGNSKANKLSKEERYFNDKCKTIEYRAKSKKIEFDLDYKFLMDLYNKQKGLCFYTKLPLLLTSKEKSKKDFNLISIDKINSNKGYTKDNVVFCLNCINMLKSNHNIEDLKGVFKILLTQLTLPIKKLNNKAILPSYAHINDAALDITCTETEFQSSQDGSKILTCKTGLAIEIPDGYLGFLLARSSICKTGLVLCNGVGLIDNNFRGEILFKFRLDANSSLGKQGIIYQPGDKIGQLLIIPYPKIYIKEVENLTETERGSGGFGSTGK